MGPSSTGALAVDNLGAMSEVVVTGLQESDPPIDTDEWRTLLGEAQQEWATLERTLPREASAQRPTPQALGDGAAADDEMLMRVARTPLGRKYLSSEVARPGQTFGIEIEFMGDHDVVRDVIAELYRLGLTSSDSQESYHSSHREKGKWIVESDPTVSAEIVSPVLTDTPETWEQLATVCEVVSRCGGYSSSATGAHVHVGVSSSGISTVLPHIQAVVGLCHDWQDMLYRLSSGADGPLHRGQRSRFLWCAPMHEAQFVDVRIADSTKALARALGGHSVGLNLGNLTKSKNARTVEFRYNDCILDAERLQANIMLDCAIMTRCANLTLDEIRELDARQGDEFTLRGTEADPELEIAALHHFADILGLSPEHRLKLYSVFARTQWQLGEGAVNPGTLYQSAIDAEVARMGEYAREHSIRLSHDDGEWLQRFVNVRSSSSGAPSRRARRVAEWWVTQPLASDVYATLERRHERATRGVPFLPDNVREAQTRSVLSNAAQHGTALSNLEQAWLLQMASLDAPTMALSAPTPVAAQVLEAWMKEPRYLGAGVDIRDCREIRKRTLKIRQNDRGIQRDKLLAYLSEPGGIPIDDSLRQLAWMAVSGVNPDQIRLGHLLSAGELANLQMLLGSASHTLDMPSLAAVGVNLFDALQPRVAPMEALESAVRGTREPLTEAERQWCNTVVAGDILAGVDATSVETVPSLRCAVGVREWQRLGGHIAEPFVAPVMSAVSAYQATRTTLKEKVEALALFELAQGHEPAPVEREWLGALLEHGPVTVAPSKESLEFANAWMGTHPMLAGEVPPGWIRQRAETLERIGQQLDRRETLEDALVSWKQEGVALRPHEVQWMVAAAEAKTSLPPSFRAAQHYNELVIGQLAQPGPTRSLWNEVGQSWMATYDDTLFHLHMQEIYRHSGRVFRGLSATDQEWLRFVTSPTLSVPAATSHHYTPSPEASALAERWAARDYLNYDGSPAPFVGLRLQANVEVWNAGVAIYKSHHDLRRALNAASHTAFAGQLLDQWNVGRTENDVRQSRSFGATLGADGMPLIPGFDQVVNGDVVEVMKAWLEAPTPGSPQVVRAVTEDKLMWVERVVGSRRHLSARHPLTQSTLGLRHAMRGARHTVSEMKRVMERTTVATPTVATPRDHAGVQ